MRNENIGDIIYALTEGDDPQDTGIVSLYAIEVDPPRKITHIIRVEQRHIDWADEGDECPIELAISQKFGYAHIELVANEGDNMAFGFYREKVVWGAWLPRSASEFRERYSNGTCVTPFVFEMVIKYLPAK